MSWEPKIGGGGGGIVRGWAASLAIDPPREVAGPNIQYTDDGARLEITDPPSDSFKSLVGLSGERFGGMALLRTQIAYSATIVSGSDASLTVGWGDTVLDIPNGVYEAGGTSTQAPVAPSEGTALLTIEIDLANNLTRFGQQGIVTDSATIQSANLPQSGVFARLEDTDGDGGELWVPFASQTFHP